MPSLYLNIGSNTGDRHAQIERAVALISSALPQARLRRSRFFESEPWGFESARLFVNLGVALDFAGDIPAPLVILDILQGIEREVGSLPHRNADGSYRDRDIDIDIIAIDTLEYRHPRLRIPHPRAALRDFVMVPLAEMAPREVIRLVEGASSSQDGTQD